MDIVMGDDRVQGRILNDLVVELVRFMLSGIKFNVNAVIGIADPSFDAHSFSKPKYKWPETYPLNLPADMDVKAFHKS